MNPRRVAVPITMVLAAGLAVSTTSPADAHQSARKHAAVTAHASRTTMVLGQKVTFTGHASRVSKGDKVILQKRVNGAKKWKKEEVHKLGRTHRFHFVDKPTSGLSRSYRVVVPATRKHTSAVSRKLGVTMYSWQYLADREARQQDGWYRNNSGDAKIDTVTFPKSLVGVNYASSGSIDYNLERACTKVRATYGVSDDSDENATATITVSADSTSIYSNTFGLLQSEAKTLDITKAFRLKFAYTVADPDDPANSQQGAIAVAGTAQVLCTR